MDETSNAVITEQHDRVLLITLNRPEERNAINGPLGDQLWSAVQRLDSDPTLTAGVLTGAGRGFCSGLDLRAFSKGENIAATIRFIKEGSSKPLIAAIEGFALAGGLELALSCDLIVASKGAKLGLPEVRVGLFAAGGGLLRLPSRLGYGRAMEMAITGIPISADEAFTCGLVCRLAEQGSAVSVAMEIAANVVANAPLAVAASKQLIRATQAVSEEEFWIRQAAMYPVVFESNDAKEGSAAFAEKRPPAWTST